MDAVMRLRILCILLGLSSGVYRMAHAQKNQDWSLDVRLLTSLPFGRPDVGEGTGWGGEALSASEGALFARWGLRGTRSYGVSIRRKLGKAGQLAFGFEQTRRIWRVDGDWMPAPASLPMSSGGMDWILASYSWPILYRTEVTLVPGWRLGAGGGIVMEVLPTNAFTAESTEQDGDVFALEHEALRYNWNRWGMVLELGLVREGENADLHIGGVLRPLVQPIVRGGLTARWNVGQSDADVRTILRSLDGSWWGLDIRVILH